MSQPLASIGSGDLIALRDLIRAGESPMDGAVLVPDGYKLESLERFSDNPWRHRGTFQAQAINPFAEYVGLNSHAADTSIFLNEDTLSAVAILDRGTPLAPGWGEHKAVLKLKKSPEWAALEEAAKSAFKQADLIDFLTEWQDFLTFSSTGIDADWTPLTKAQAIVALRKLKTSLERQAEHVEHDQQRSKTVFERAAIDSSPPPLMRWTGRPADELEERQVTILLVYLPQDPPLIKLRIIGKDRLMQSVGQEFKDLVAGRITTDISIHLGSFVS